MDEIMIRYVQIVMNGFVIAIAIYCLSWIIVERIKVSKR
jgi:phage shock protein PspC (stress-responsive transcriptional regulator)